MKKLLVLVFSLFFLSSPSVFADDISDFQIEGISIGDSLLDYMTQDEILKEIEINKDRFLHLKEPHKYSQINLYKDFLVYDNLSFVIKNNSTNKYVTDKNERYMILSVRGLLTYIEGEDYDDCIKDRDEILEILFKMFPDAEKLEQIQKYSPDPSGNSIVDFKYLILDSGEQIDLYCINLDETFKIKKDWLESLNVSIKSPEIIRWLRNTK